MKRRISLLVISVLIIEMILTSIGGNFVFAENANRKITFSDISGHWCQEFIEKFAERKWVFGYDDGLFYPDKYVTRAEFTSIVVNIFKKTAKQSENIFTDVSEKDWFYNAVTYAVGENLIRGYEDGTFKPYNNMTRQDAAVLTANLFDVNFFTGAPEVKFKDEDTFPQYSYQSIKNLASHEIIKGYPDGTFRPFNLITRAEAVRMLDVVLKYIEIPEETMPAAPVETPVVTKTPQPTPTLTPKPTGKSNSGGGSGKDQTSEPRPTSTPIPTPTATAIVKDSITVVMDVYGSLKQNRTVAFSVYANSLYDEYPIIEDMTEWTITPLMEDIEQTDIKIDELNSTPMAKTALFKKPGDYKVKVTVSNSLDAAELERILTIIPDEKPVADFEVNQTYFRDGNYAKIELKDKSYSPDNDYIKQRIWKVRWDSDNDGDFEDEKFEIISDLNEERPIYTTTRVGKYQVELEVVEGFGDKTVNKYITESDYQRADTSLKTAELKTFIVENAVPEASFTVEKKKKLDVVFTVGKADNEKVDEYSEYIKDFSRKMSEAGIDANISTIETQTYTTTNTFDWQEYDHYNYVDTYTNPAWPNPMEKHILFDGKDIQMVGYTVVEMKDFLFVPDNNKTQKTFTFDIRRDSTDWHSIEGGGFLFNASIENNILKGYCILITRNGLVLDEIPGINLTMFRDGKYELVEYAGKKLATYNIGDVYANHSWKIVIDPESITLWDNGNLIIDNFKLPNTNYGSGFGPITSHANHACQQMSYFTFKNIEMTTILGKSLTQAIEEFEWREDAQHLIVNLSDELLFELNTDDKIAYIASKLIEKDVDLYALGNEENRSQYEGAIKGAVGKGAFALNEDLDKAMKNLKNYALRKFNDEDFAVRDYMVLGEEAAYSISYYDIENDPEYDMQWYYLHNPDIFENNHGLSVSDSVYMAEPVTIFDKVGEYTIQLMVRDNPAGEDDSLDEYRRWSDGNKSQKTITVHRLPLASIEVKTYLNENKDGCNVKVIESVVDLDHQSDSDSGIISREYKWKNIKDSDWTYGEFPNTLPLDNYYIFVLTVKDKEGAVSKPAVQIVSTKVVEETEPIIDTVNPRVSLSLSKSSVVVGETVTLTASMSDNVGIAYTKATIDGKPAYFDAKGYCIYKTDTVGEIVIYIEVYDAAGNSASAQKTLTVKADMPPTVSISAPDKVAVNETFTITVNASDDVKVTLVEAEVDGNPIVLNSSKQYKMTPSSVGEIVVTAKAYDSEGKVSTVQKTITVTEDTTAPTVSITSTLYTVAVGQPFTITVKATDNVGVTKVEAEVDGKPIDLNSNLQYTIMPEQIGKIYIKAFAHDEKGNVGVAEREITVTEDTTSPSVSISSTASTVVVYQAFTITVNASDNVGVVKVEAEADGVPLVLDENRKCVIVPEQTGVITIKAYAYDSKENVGTAERKITVNADTTPPSVSISSTASSIIAGKPVTITVSASDNAKVARIEADADGVPLVLDESGKCTIIPETPGTLVITARAYDASDNVGTATRNITVQADTSAPSVSISTTASRVAAGSPFTITVSASDNVGVTAIETYINEELVTLDENNQYTYIPKKEGTVVIIAKAYDKAGNVKEAQRTVTVTADTVKPTVTISVDKTEVRPGESVRFTATATDNVGIAKIEAFFGEQEITLNEEGKGTFKPTQSGKIVVNAYDYQGNIGTAEEYITVDETAEPEDDYEKPIVKLELSANVVDKGEEVTIVVTAMDNVAVEKIAADIEGSLINLDEAGSGKILAEEPGFYNIQARAIDVNGNEGIVVNQLFVKGTSDNKAPDAIIESPSDSSKITEPVDIVGTAFDDNIVKYVLEYSEFGKNNYITFAEGFANVSNGVLGRLDPTMMRNGQYNIRLSVYDAGGTVSKYTVTYILEGKLKIGNFSLEFEDMQVSMTGLPISIVRTYDSRNKTAGDFGIGWTMSINDIRISENIALESYWSQSASGGFLPTYTIKEDKEHLITVTYPDGATDKFGMQLTPNSQALYPITFATVSFVAKSGTLSKLEALDIDNDVIFGIPLYTLDGEVYNPNRYKLTTSDGVVYIINQSTGVESITDLNGNTIKFSKNGIINASGKSVVFERDSEGRITKISDPYDRSISYEYDYYGDLISVTDQGGYITRFTYDFNHGLIDIIDPRGVKVVRNEYDDEGRLIASIDAEGNRVEYSRDIEARQEVVKDRLGNITMLYYDSNGNILSQTDALGNTKNYTYDSEGRMLTETNPLGYTTTYTYDSTGNVTSITDPFGNKKEFVYNDKGKLIKEIDVNGNITENKYDSKGNLIQNIDALGNVTEFDYDSKGNLTKGSSTQGNSITFTYDSEGRILSQTESNGKSTKYKYDSMGNCIEESVVFKTAEGEEIFTTYYEYDNMGRVIKTTDANGISTQIEYNSIGKEAAIIDHLGNKDEYHYDSLGNLVKIEYHDGLTEEYEYDKEGRKISFTKKDGSIEKYEYDKIGRLIKTIFADGSYRTKKYDAVGNVIEEADENGNTTKYEFDKLGRNIAVTDALGNVTENKYDVSGNLTEVKDANGNITKYEYNKKGQLTKTIYPDGNAMTIEYDKRGYKSSETDRAGKTTKFEYDSNGNLVKVVDAIGNTTEYVYDANGKIVSHTDANGNTTKFEYDIFGKLVKKILPLGMFETYAYDVFGNMTSTTDYSGKVTTYEYDGDGRLLKKVYEDGSEEKYTYTIGGNRKTVTDKNGTTAYSYDVLGRLIEEKQSDGTTISYTYDKVGNRTSMVTPSGKTTYSYDKLNRLSTVVDSDGGVTKYEYDKVGNRTAVTYPNGTKTEYKYDSLNCLVEVINTKGDEEIISSYKYTLGLAGNRIKVEENTGRTVEYEYDDTYKLIKEVISHPVNGKSVISYTYDKVGNRLTMTTDGNVLSYTYDKNNRLLSEGENTYTYDSNGNILSITGPNGKKEYFYENNKLVKVVTTDGSQTSIAAFKYDVDGIRVGKSYDGKNFNKYIVDKNRDYAQVIEERDSKGNIVVSYVYGDDLISQKRANEISYYHYDGLGSTRALTDEKGNVTDTYNYDAFGVLIEKTGDTINEYLYTGEQYDPNLGFYYLRSRYMDPSTGRFTSMDSFSGIIHDPISLHKYLYAHANPVMNTDPSGQFIMIWGLMGQIPEMWARTADLRFALKTYLKAEEAIEKINLVMNVTAVVVGFLCPAVSRDSLTLYKVQLSHGELSVEIRYGKSILKEEFDPVQLRIGFKEKATGQSVRFDFSWKDGKPNFDGVSLQQPAIPIFEKKVKIGKVKTEAVIETSNIWNNPAPGITFGLNFKFEPTIGPVFTARSPRFDIINGVFK